MQEIIGDDPGSPDDVWGGKRLHLGPLLDIFVSENVMGTSERQERYIAAFFFINRVRLLTTKCYRIC